MADSSNPFKKRPSRRNVIQGLAAGVAVSIAGCGSSGGGDGGGGDGGGGDGGGGSDGGGSNGGGSSDGGDGGGGSPSGERVPNIEITVRTQEAEPITNETANLIKPAWEELGLTVQLNTMSHQAYIEKCYTNHDYHCHVGGWGGAMNRLDPYKHTFLTYHSSQAEQGLDNMTHISNDEMDSLCEEATTTLDNEARQEIVYEQQQLASELQPSTPINTDILVSPINVDTVTEFNPIAGQGMVNYFAQTSVETTHGEFNWGGRGTVNTLNPLNVPSATDRHMNNLIHDKLFQFGEGGELTPSLAQSRESIDDTTLQATLRDETMEFHDGEEVTVEDVKFSYEYAKEVGAVPVSSNLEPLENVEIIDDRTVQFNLSEPFAPFGTNGLAFPYIIPKHIWENIPESVDVASALDWPNPEPVGCGPFQYDNWRPEESMTVTKFEGHHNEPVVDSVTKVMGPLQSLVRSLENQDLDAVWGNGLSVSAVQTAAQQDHIEIRETPSHGVDNAFYRVDKEPFNDQAFRQAIAHAVPKADVREIVVSGFGSTIHTNIAPVNQFWHNPDVNKYGNDVEQGRQVLEEAGYTWDNNGNLHYPS